MLALDLWRSLQCSGCGGHLMETTEHEDWVPEPPTRCHRCTVIAIAQQNSNRPQPLALMWGASRRGR